MNYIELSKTISHALRHKPEEYGLTLDAEGFTSLEALRNAIRSKVQKYANIELDDIFEAVKRSDKNRHEIRDGKIRAYYGHSSQNAVEHVAAIPPDVLYHGTDPNLWSEIQSKGLLPVTRQLVHLSSDIATAEIVGKRKASTPIILRIDAKRASSDGHVFYIGNDTIWLTDSVEPQYIELVTNEL